MKRIKTFVAFAVATLSCLCLASCAKENDQVDNSAQYGIYQTYVVFAEGQGVEPMSYEQWIETIKGIDGSNGLTPSIGENGTWWIGDTDTKIAVTGPKGEKGDQGIQGVQGEKGIQGETGNGIEVITSKYETGEDGKQYLVLTVKYTNSETPVEVRTLAPRQILAMDIEKTIEKEDLSITSIKAVGEDQEIDLKATVYYSEDNFEKVNITKSMIKSKDGKAIDFSIPNQQINAVISYNGYSENCVLSTYDGDNPTVVLAKSTFMDGYKNYVVFWNEKNEIDFSPLRTDAVGCYLTLINGEEKFVSYADENIDFRILNQKGPFSYFTYVCYNGMIVDLITVSPIDADMSQVYANSTPTVSIWNFEKISPKSSCVAIRTSQTLEEASEQLSNYYLEIKVPVGESTFALYKLYVPITSDLFDSEDLANFAFDTAGDYVIKLSNEKIFNKYTGTITLKISVRDNLTYFMRNLNFLDSSSTGAYGLSEVPKQLCIQLTAVDENYNELPCETIYVVDLESADIPEGYLTSGGRKIIPFTFNGKECVMGIMLFDDVSSNVMSVELEEYGFMCTATLGADADQMKEELCYILQNEVEYMKVYYFDREPDFYRITRDMIDCSNVDTSVLGAHFATVSYGDYICEVPVFILIDNSALSECIMQTYQATDEYGMIKEIETCTCGDDVYGNGALWSVGVNGKIEVLAEETVEKVTTKKVKLVNSEITMLFTLITDATDENNVLYTFENTSFDQEDKITYTCDFDEDYGYFIEVYKDNNGEYTLATFFSKEGEETYCGYSTEFDMKKDGMIIYPSNIDGSGNFVKYERVIFDHTNRTFEFENGMMFS